MHYPSISEVSVTLVPPKEGLLAFGSCLLSLGDSFKLCLGSLAIKRALKGDIRVVFPARIVRGREFYTYRPANDATRRLIRDALVDRYLELTQSEEHGESVVLPSSGLSACDPTPGIHVQSTRSETIDASCSANRTPH